MKKTFCYCILFGLSLFLFACKKDNTSCHCVHYIDGVEASSYNVATSGCGDCQSQGRTYTTGIGNFQVLLISIRLFAPVNKTIMQRFTLLVNTTDNTGMAAFFTVAS